MQNIQSVVVEGQASIFEIRLGCLWKRRHYRFHSVWYRCGRRQHIPTNTRYHQKRRVHLSLLASVYSTPIVHSAVPVVTNNSACNLASYMIVDCWSAWYLRRRCSPFGVLAGPPVPLWHGRTGLPCHERKFFRICSRGDVRWQYINRGKLVEGQTIIGEVEP